MARRVNAIITGATGFIGSALVRNLLESGSRVAVIIREDSPNLWRLGDNNNLTVVNGELSNMKEWPKALSGFRADVFYHLAWDGVGNTSRNETAQAANIEPALATMQIAKMLGCTRWIGTGSQAEYGPLNKPISEKEPTEPSTLYGAAKLSTCLLSQIFGKQIGIGTAWGRIFSTYGPEDNPGWMLVDLIKKILRGQRPMLTMGEQIWDYLYVDDAAEALRYLGNTPNASGIYNIGSGRSQTIRSIVEMVRDMIDPDFPLVFGEIQYRPDQVMHLEASIDKIHKETGWYPKTELETGLRLTIEAIKKAVKKYES